jgi:hypothetical protein
MTSLSWNAAVAALLLGPVVVVQAGSLGASSAAGGSSASAGSSASSDASSNSSGGKQRAAAGPYRIIDVAEVAGQPGQVRLELHRVVLTRTLVRVAVRSLLLYLEKELLPGPDGSDRSLWVDSKAIASLAREDAG